MVFSTAEWWESSKQSTSVLQPDVVFFRRSSSYVAAIFASAFVMEIAFDGVADRLWDYSNKGVLMLNFSVNGRILAICTRKPNKYLTLPFIFSALSLMSPLELRPCKMNDQCQMLFLLYKLDFHCYSLWQERMKRQPMMGQSKYKLHQSSIAT